MADTRLAWLSGELVCGGIATVQAWFDRLAWWSHPKVLFETYAWIPFTYPFNLTGRPWAHHRPALD